MVPSATVSTEQPWWGQVVPKAANVPATGWVTTTPRSARTSPPPRGGGGPAMLAPPAGGGAEGAGPPERYCAHPAAPSAARPAHPLRRIVRLPVPGAAQGRSDGGSAD